MSLFGRQMRAMGCGSTLTFLLDCIDLPIAACTEVGLEGGPRAAIKILHASSRTKEWPAHNRTDHECGRWRRRLGTRPRGSPICSVCAPHSLRGGGSGVGELLFWTGG